MSPKQRTVWTFLFVTFVIENLWSTDALKTVHKCSCATGCDFTQYCAPSGNCRKENVALGRPAEMSSMYGYEDRPSGPACVAVNGNTNSVYQPMFNGELNPNPNCIHTGMGDRNAWWLVRLARKYTITEVVVYFRIKFSVRMDNVVIMVDDQECYTFPFGTKSSSTNKTIYCISPRRGSVLKLYKNGIGQPEYFLNICEVQIWVCRPGLYGENCDRFCNCQNNATCDNLSGMCNSDCEPGYNGEDCNYQCGYCRGGAACNITDGKCPDGCDTAYKPPFCKEACNEGYYGLNCSQKCGNCILGMSCNVFSGVCQYGCEDGFLLPLCKEKCSPGTWGIQCKSKCGNCNGSTCRHDNGSCETGCIPGFEGDLCTAFLDQKSDMFENRVVIGAIIGGSLFVGVSILTAMMIWLCWIRVAQNDSGRRSNENNHQCADAGANENSATGEVNNDDTIVRKVGGGVEGAKRYTELINKKQDGKEPNQIDQDSDYEDMSSPYANV